MLNKLIYRFPLIIYKNPLLNKSEASANRRSHYDNTPIQYTVIFHGCKNDNFQMKNCDIFLIFAQSIDCGYPQSNIDCGYTQSMLIVGTHNLCFRAINKNKNMYTNVNLNFTI